MVKKSSEIEEIKQFIAELMNEEQDRYSKLCLDLNHSLGGTKVGQDAENVLEKIFNEKTRLLDKIFKKVQSI